MIKILEKAFYVLGYCAVIVILCWTIYWLGGKIHNNSIATKEMMRETVKEMVKQESLR